MSDLFWRLAQRARADAAAQLTAETETELGPIAEEAVEDNLETSAPVADLVTPPAPVEQPPRPTVEYGEAPSTPAGVTDREIRLVPMPLVAPPSAPPIVAGPRVETDRSSPSERLASAATDAVPAATDAPELDRAAQRRVSLVPVPPPPNTGPAATPAGIAERDRPAIDITVGRIEVRVRPPALVQSETQRRPAEPAPALTLEEYLRRREVPS